MSVVRVLCVPFPSPSSPRISLEWTMPSMWSTSPRVTGMRLWPDSIIVRTTSEMGTPSWTVTMSTLGTMTSLAMVRSRSTTPRIMRASCSSSVSSSPSIPSPSAGPLDAGAISSPSGLVRLRAAFSSRVSSGASSFASTRTGLASLRAARSP